jgi:putative FmdB family regulatory protein
MPIYEYRCEDCGKISEFLVLKTDEVFVPQCKRCKSKKMSRVLSRVRVVRSEESRLESLADPSRWGDLDENDPKSMARMMKRMGKELGEDVDNVDEMIDEAMEEEMATTSDKEPEE